MNLQPSDIANAFTLTEINERITAIMTAIESSEESKSDRFSDGQADQSVMRQELNKLYDSLSIWVKAKNILTGASSSTAELIQGNYNPGYPRL